MRNRVLFLLVALGILGGLVSAYVYGAAKKPLPPAFAPASNPYARGIYANGIIESYQAHGENISIYAEVAGVVTGILVTEGQKVSRGTPLLIIDDSVQRATTEQLRSQADAALALLTELKAQPRPEVLRVAAAQVKMAAANLKSAEDSRDKQLRSFEIAPKSVSKEVLDSAINAAKVAAANLDVAKRQYELTKAGAWIYDIQNQEAQYKALSSAYASANALLEKHVIRAPQDGVILSIGPAVGSYVSAQGTYNIYTQGFDPVLVMGATPETLAVRCYIDEILVPRLPKPSAMHAKMFIRGTNISVPLQFVRIQPLVQPKIQLSSQRTERVDVRVLPIVFRFESLGSVAYPGQLVDVYIGSEELPPGAAPHQAGAAP